MGGKAGIGEKKDAYAKAGVDIDEATVFVEMIKGRIAKAWPGEEKNIGGFAGAVSIPRGAFQMVGSTDGVGTKLIIASIVNNFEGVGIDAVAMSAVDSYVAGIRPSYILDYLATGKLVSEKHIAIIDSLIEGCKMANCKLIGGETAEMPRFFRHDWYVDLVTFSAGFDNQPINFPVLRDGQRVIALPSYGLGSNGFSLARKACDLVCSPSKARRKLMSTKIFGRPLHEVLLTPTPIWINTIDQELDRGVMFSAMVHVTGGGLIDNPPRVLPENLAMVIDRSSWRRPEIFSFIQEKEKVSVSDMDRSFNNGLMMLLVVDDLSESEGYSPDFKNIPYLEVGTIVKRRGNEPQVQMVGEYCD